MKIWQLIIKEIRFRKFSFTLSLISVAVAIAALSGSVTLLKTHDYITSQILENKELETKAQMDKLVDDMRKTTLKLGLNVAILPKAQSISDWRTDDFGTTYMPEKYTDILANSGIVTIRHLLPILQHKIKWPEKKRTVILIGSRGEVPNMHKSPRKVIVEPVPYGTMVVGYELHQSLNLKVGDKIRFMGKEFTISKCHQERGSKDDVTIWIHLEQAQQLLDKKGLINAIIALECICAKANIANVRSEISKILPETQVVELGRDKIIARYEARMKVAQQAKASIENERILRADLRNQREKLASVLVIVVLVACGIWIGFLALHNVRERRCEIGILRALGLRSTQIIALFLSKALITGFLGGTVGFVLGLSAGKWIGIRTEEVSAELIKAQNFFDPKLLILALILAPLLSAIASWIPAIIATQQDPAEILQTE